MTQPTKDIRYILPKPEKYLDLVQELTITALLRDEEPAIYMPPLISKAYNLVNEIEALQYSEFEDNTEEEDKIVGVDYGG